MSAIRIAIDAMGGDFGPRLCVPASQTYAAGHPEVRITLVGDQDRLEQHFDAKLPQLEILHTPVEVEMAERPSQALRHKSESSLALAIDLVARHDAQACVSAGNTGAMMAFAKRKLGLLSGLDRPAICKALPTRRGACWVLDLGATTDCDASDLLQFAQMGRVVAQCNGVQKPRIALLNNGIEQNKGRTLEKQAAELLRAQLGGEYIGYIEAHDVFMGEVDVVVCDGFCGNVLLKASEGVTEFLQASLEQIFNRSVLGRMSKRLARPFLGLWRKEYNVSRHNGAIFLGLRQPVIKSHGAASREGFAAAISVAEQFVAKQALAAMSNQFSHSK